MRQLKLEIPNATSSLDKVKKESFQKLIKKKEKQQIGKAEKIMRSDSIKKVHCRDGILTT